MIKLTSAIATFTNDYLAYEGINSHDRRFFKVQDMADRWEIEVLYNIEGDKPLGIFANFWHDDDCLMKFQDSASDKGFERVAKWLEAMLTLNF